MNKDPVDSLYIMCVIRPFSALFICTNTAFKKRGVRSVYNRGLSKKRRGVLKRVLKSERKEGGGGSKRDDGRGTLNLSNLLFFPS